MTLTTRVAIMADMTHTDDIISTPSFAHGTPIVSRSNRRSAQALDAYQAEANAIKLAPGEFVLDLLPGSRDSYFVIGTIDGQTTRKWDTPFYRVTLWKIDTVVIDGAIWGANSGTKHDTQTWLVRCDRTTV